MSRRPTHRASHLIVYWMKQLQIMPFSVLLTFFVFVRLWHCRELMEYFQDTCMSPLEFVSSFLKVDFLSLYTIYCTSYAQGNECLERSLTDNPELREFIEVRECPTWKTTTKKTHTHIKNYVLIWLHWWGIVFCYSLCLAMSAQCGPLPPPQLTAHQASAEDSQVSLTTGWTQQALWCEPPLSQNHLGVFC